MPCLWEAENLATVIYSFLEITKLSVFDSLCASSNRSLICGSVTVYVWQCTSQIPDHCVQKPNSWTFNFVEISGHNLEGSQTWGFRIQCLRYILYQLRPRIRPQSSSSSPFTYALLPQRVSNDLQRTRHSCDSMIRLLPHPPPSPISKVSLFLSLPVCLRSSLLTEEGGKGWARS